MTNEGTRGRQPNEQRCVANIRQTDVIMLTDYRRRQDARTYTLIVAKECVGEVLGERIKRTCGD